MTVRHLVLVCDTAFIDGGSAQVALTSALELADRGYHVTIFAGVGPALPELLAHPNIDVVCLDQKDILSDTSRLRAATQGLWNLSAARAFDALLANCDRDETVVHVHCWTKSLTASPIHAALRHHFRTVITLHEFFTVCPIGSLYNHPRAEICNLQPMSLACVRENCDSRSYAHKVWRVARQVMQQRVAGVPARVRDFITVSELSHEVLEPLLPATSRLHPVAYPIAAVRADAVDAAAHGSFAYVGRLSMEKGADLFAAAAVAEGVPHIFIGDGPSRADVEAISPGAIITGWQDHDGVVTHLREARALVFPSRWYETFGLVVMEAAALGIPAIVPDSSAAARNVVDGVTGLIFRSGDVVDLRRKIAMLADDERVRAMSRATYDRFWKSPSTIVTHVDRLLDVYATLPA